MPRDVEARYRTSKVGDRVPGSSAGGYQSVPPTFVGAQKTPPRKLDNRYSTGTFNKAGDMSDATPSSGITGIIKKPTGPLEQAEKPERRGSPILIIIAVIIMLLIAAAIGFFVLHTIGVIK